MEALSIRHLISLTHGSFPIRFPRIPVQKGRLGMRVGHSRFISHSKLSDFQDFQGYARPLRLLPATETNMCTESSVEEISTFFRVDGSRSLYMIKLRTSSFSDSSMSDLNAGILLCLIEENGDSILQRITASPVKDSPRQSREETVPNLFYFQRGSVDAFSFEGPKLEKVIALWIGLESGRWRLGGVSLTVIHGCQPPIEVKDAIATQYNGLKYEFEVEDILFGEGGDMSMAELRPCLITELPGVDLFTLLNMELSRTTSVSSHELSNQESMKEYADLKFSLLLYDAVLVFAGTSIATFSAEDRAAFAFLTGGVVGFLYLLLLQRSVDGLPTPASISMNTEGESLNQLFGRLKGPISTLALALVFAVIAVNYGPGDEPVVLTPKEVMVGMMGFLVCKVAVVLAAIKPMPTGLKANK